MVKENTSNSVVKSLKAVIFAILMMKIRLFVNQIAAQYNLHAFMLQISLENVSNIVKILNNNFELHQIDAERWIRVKQSSILQM